MASNWTTDRSTILDGQACPRKRYWHRHYRSQGIQRKSKSLPLAFGGAFHVGSEALLLGKGIETAVLNARLDLSNAFAESGIDTSDDPISLYGQQEQAAIAEGLLRAWWAYEGERFLEEFEVLEVEQEGRADLGANVTLLFRPDALVRERSTGDLYVVSWKTAAMFGQHTLNQCQTDMQSMSEVYGVQQTWRETSLSVAGGNVEDAKADFGELKIEGVLYRFAVKGQRRMDDYLGFKVQDTPLAYGWIKKGALPEDDVWAWRYKWQTEEINPRTGKPAWTQLPKGFKKVSIWDNYLGGVKGWIDALTAGDVTPMHISPFESIFPQSLPVSRRADEIESWRRQTVASEERWRNVARIVALSETDYLVSTIGGEPHQLYEVKPKGDELLDRLFPQHTARCLDYSSRCPFWEACFTPAVHADPLASGLYQIRVNNYPEKLEESE